MFIRTKCYIYYYTHPHIICVETNRLQLIEMYFVFALKDGCQNAVPLKELTHQPSESYMESKRVVLDWLNQIESSLTANDCKITFLPVLEDKLILFKVTNK